MIPRPCKYRHPELDPACAVCRQFAAQGWEGREPVKVTANRPPTLQVLAGGPGAELGRLLAGLGARSSVACQCKARMRQMDEWGGEGCRKHRSEIVGWLAEERAKAGWWQRARAAVLAVSTGALAWLDPLDPLGSVVDEAIRRAATPPRPWADRIVVINLDRRVDRLEAFQRQAARWPELAGWVHAAAVDGKAVDLPPDWKGGPGALGCKLSHLAVLSSALADGIGTLAVFEDDVRFSPDFGGRLAAFLAAVPSDWEGLLLGCEGQRPAPLITPGVRRVVNAQRTHAYVVRGRPALEALHALWSEATTHIDHHWFRWQEGRPVYQPDPLLCGQAAGASDIVSKPQRERWWQGRGLAAGGGS